MDQREGRSRMETRKVEAEIVKERTGTSPLSKAKLLVAIILDAVDLVVANIPLLNSVWDIVTWLVLLTILRRKHLAYLALGELILPGVPPIGLIDGLIPTATLIVIADMIMQKIKPK